MICVSVWTTRYLRIGMAKGVTLEAHLYEQHMSLFPAFVSPHSLAPEAPSTGRCVSFSACRILSRVVLRVGSLPFAEPHLAAKDASVRSRVLAGENGVVREQIR